MVEEASLNSKQPLAKFVPRHCGRGRPRPFLVFPKAIARTKFLSIVTIDMFGINFGVFRHEKSIATINFTPKPTWTPVVTPGGHLGVTERSRGSVNA